MTQRDDARRQHAEDRAVIDHLTEGPLKPAKGGNGQRIGEEKGRAVNDALQRQDQGPKGGLPEF